MRIIRHPSECPAALTGSVLALGNFDGAHRGHQAILQKTLAIAADSGAPSAVMTFEPHPISILRMGMEPLRITPFRQKAQLIEQAGIAVLFVMHFTRKFSLITAEDFIRTILQQQLGVQHIVIGEDFHFGRGRGGNAALLAAMAEECGYTLTRLADSDDGTERFSSTRIREALRAGDIAQANALLGHPYILEGRVMHGEQRGEDLLDCPTANLPLKDHLHPKFGVYISETQREGHDDWLPSITHIGLNSTFGGQKAVAETHIFNFNAPLYGIRIKVKPLKFLRPEEQFTSIEALKAAMDTDIAHARSHFGL